MATVRRPARPIAPHLSVYERGPHMIVSILHRITGDSLAIAGLMLLLGWLGAVAAGPAAYQSFINWVWMPNAGNSAQTVVSWAAKAVLVGLTWAFFQHMLSGIRHLVLDTGAGYGLPTNRFWSRMVLGGGIVLTAIVWLLIFARGL